MSSINNIIERTIYLSASEQNPVDLLAIETGISKSKIKQAMTSGAVWLKTGN
jgi:tRNA pseudouridine32 synthase / 23S rRNA pseudouridine746 synthase